MKFIQVNKFFIQVNKIFILMAKRLNEVSKMRTDKKIG